MKKILSLLIIALLVTAGAVYASYNGRGTSSTTPQNKAEAAGNKVLIVYFSHSGNTAKAAEALQQATGGCTMKLIPCTPYPQDYDTCVEQAKKEIKEGFEPELIPANIAFDAFDVVFIGSPNWWGTIAPPVRTFLKTYDLSGKKVAFFNTHGGGGMQRCEKDLKALLPKNAVYMSGIALSGNDTDSYAQDIPGWLKGFFKAQPKK